MINLIDLQPGERVHLAGGAIGEVTDNPGDGQWIQVRIVEHPDDPDMVDEIELFHSEDVLDPPSDA